MAVRYYLSPIVGAGTSLNTYRAKAQDVFRTAVQAGVPCSFKALIPSGMSGGPRESWALCEIDLPDFALLDADTTLALLTRRSLLETAPSAATDTALAKFGLTRHGGDLTVIAVLRRVMRQLEQNAEVR